MTTPKSINKEIRSIQRKFLWGGLGDNNKWALVGWDNMCLQKIYEGLGFRDPDKCSEALEEKILRCWITHDYDPWAQVWHSKYAPR